MIDFPKLDNCTVFPLPESSNLEFKLSFNSSMAEKIYATICGILNCGGGYLVIGIEDETRRIVGVKPDKCMDNFLLMLDTIYHHNHIKKQDGTPIPIGTITSGTVQAADDKEVLVVTIKAEPNTTYTVKNGNIWYRLAASNFKKTELPTIYTEKEFEIILRQKLTAQSNMLYQQFDLEKKAITKKHQSKYDVLRHKFQDLEADFRKLLGAAKDTEKNLSEFRDMIFDNIKLQKDEAEKELGEPKRSWWQEICCL